MLGCATVDVQNRLRAARQLAENSTAWPYSKAPAQWSTTATTPRSTPPEIRLLATAGHLATYFRRHDRRPVGARLLPQMRRASASRCMARRPMRSRQRRETRSSQRRDRRTSQPVGASYGARVTARATNQSALHAPTAGSGKPLLQQSRPTEFGAALRHQNNPTHRLPCLQVAVRLRGVGERVCLAGGEVDLPSFIMLKTLWPFLRW